jgi:hypothetical protein
VNPKLEALMIPNDLKKELNVAIESALLFASKDIQPINLAKQIVVSEHQLLSKVQEYLVLDRLVSMITRKLSSKQPNLQLDLPGFESLPYRISIHGERTVLGEATLVQLKSYRDILQNQTRKHRAKIEPLDKLIKLVAPYDAKKRNITVADVILAEKRKREQLG